jgi:hypothetical protein
VSSLIVRSRPSPRSAAAIAGLLHELAGDRVRSGAEELGGIGALRQLAPPLTEHRGELRQEPAEVLLVHRPEAGGVAGMARRSRGMHLHQERVVVAVGHELDQVHHVAARLALLPQLPS